MDARTLDALKGSIAKWKAIEDGYGIDDGENNCPLCEAFADTEDDEGIGCTGCPVRDHTQVEGCADTPYFEWRQAHQRSRLPLSATTERHKELARAEREFLESLLPDGEKK